MHRILGIRVARMLAPIAAVLLCVCLAQTSFAANALGVPDVEYDALVALYNSTGGPDWNDNTNWLTANPDWHGVNVGGGHVVGLTLQKNNLSGNLPTELGDFTSLMTLDLSGNALTGGIPSSIVNLTALGWASLGYNQLFCSDPSAASFLSTKDCCWQNTQTVPPTNVSAQRMADGSILVSWDTIQFNRQDGYYEVGYSQTPGGPYIFDETNRTPDKESNSLWVDGQDPNQPVCLVVRTITLPHSENPSTLTSSNSEEVTPELFPQGSKLTPNGANVSFGDTIITAVFPDCCYAESEDRTWGLRVVSPDGGYPDPGTRVEAFGTMQTNADGERYLEVTDGRFIGTGTIAPLGVTNRSLGGANYYVSPTNGAGQIGVTGGTGLNNVGLLVRTTGACTWIGAHKFMIDDGSGVPVTCKTPPTMLASTSWDYVAVTGISSIRKVGDTHERVLRVTKVEPIVSRPPEGVTGRWEMTTTSGDMSGVYGMLLVQNGNTVAGSMRGFDILNGQMDGQVFTGSCLVDANGKAVDSVLNLDGDTLSGTWTITDEGTFPVTFHRVSSDPASPYVGAPQVVSAACNGLSIDVTWDRPINGWDYDIRDDNGQSLTDWSGGANSYDPETNTFHMSLNTWTPLTPGQHYTIYLESGDQVDWHDPYGVAAWDSEWNAYNFGFIYQTPPPPPDAPSFVLGFHTSDMPTQWVTCVANWPEGATSMKLYQSADSVNWTPTNIEVTNSAGHAGATFEQWSDAYFRFTAISPNGESAPSDVIYARPFEVEHCAITIDQPAEGSTAAQLFPTFAWHPSWSQSAVLKCYYVELHTESPWGTIWAATTTSPTPPTSVIYGQIAGMNTIIPAVPLALGTSYQFNIDAVDEGNWFFASGCDRHFTTADSVTSEDVSGAWEAISTSGQIAGGFGMLLTQDGGAVTGTARGWTISNGEVSGNVFTCTFTVENGPDVVSQLVLDGDTLTGAFSVAEENMVIPITLHKISSTPVSPYQGQPQVVSATFDGSSLHITWDRPVNGWDYSICRQDGQDIVDWQEDENLAYNPDTYTFTVPVHTWEPLVEGETYTIYLDSGDEVDWHDPFGAPAWDSAEDCYSFQYTYQALPPTPEFVLGRHAIGMPDQWVTIQASWPEEYGLKLYQSTDQVHWSPMDVTPLRQGYNGEFTFELWSNAYFAVTTVGDGMESLPSAIVHARPFETETSGIVMDAPTSGESGVAVIPTFAWHPVWSQSAVLAHYGLMVVDPSTGDPTWQVLTSNTPPQTMLVYGQTQEVLTALPMDGPLARNSSYIVVVGAYDTENWLFASSPATQFTTTVDGNGGGTSGDYTAIAALYEAIKNGMEAHDLGATMSHFAPDYLHNGEDWAALQSNLADGISHITSVDYDITGISITPYGAIVQATINVSFDSQAPISITEPDTGGDGLGMGWLVSPAGEWLVHGDQVRGRVELHTVRQPDGSYGLRFQAMGPGLVSGTVSGPNVGQASLYWDATWNDFRQWVVPSQTPQVGDVYAFDLVYDDGRRETISSVVSSLVPVCPSLMATIQADGSVSLNWNDISSQVPGASHYWVLIQNQNGYGYTWSSDDLSLDTTSITTPPLMAGQTYRCELYIYDDRDNVSTCAVDVTIPSGDGPPPAP